MPKPDYNDGDDDDVGGNDNDDDDVKDYDDDEKPGHGKVYH